MINLTSIIMVFIFGIAVGILIDCGIKARQVDRETIAVVIIIGVLLVQLGRWVS